MKPLQHLQLWIKNLRIRKARVSLPDAPPKTFTRWGIDIPKTGLMLFTILALSALMSIHFLPTKIGLKVGDRSEAEIRAGRSVRYFDSVQTERAQYAAELSVRPIYKRDENAPAEARRIVQEFFARVNTMRTRFTATKPPLKPAAFLANLSPQERPDLDAKLLTHLLTLTPSVFAKLEALSDRLIMDAMEREIRDLDSSQLPANDTIATRRAILDNAKSLLASVQEAQIVFAVAEQATRPNSFYNRVATQAAKEKARADTPPAYGRVTLNEKIIGVNELVTQEQIEKFTALGLQNPRMELTTGFAVCVLAAAMVILVAVKIARTHPKLYADTRRLTLLSVVALLSVFGLKVGATMLGLQFSSGQLGYLGMSSVASAGMVVCVLLDANLAVLIAALLSVQSGLIMNHEIRFTVMTLMSSLVGISCVDSVRRKANPLQTALILAATNVGMVWLLGMLLQDSLSELATGSGWAVGAAGFATFLFWSGCLLLEKPFGILTHSTLLELSAFDRPLLQKLCIVAPGTYAHSIMVGTLAEAGAQAVGANGLLARVGGYYHDIGKMKRPGFFVENQRKENVHGRLSPTLSALIIIAHVRDGLEMAKEHRLPAEIRDIIAQHHGTTLIRYFYHQALMDCGGPDEAPPGLEERFRYPGPKPQTRESAVVMFADSVEAATRCMDKPTPERLENRIHTLIWEKVEDGQLDNCDLSFKDIKQIVDAFLHVLSAMMHERIDYPAMPRTGSGQPMETARPDLDLQPVVATIEAARASIPSAAERFNDLGAALDAEMGLDHEAARDMFTHLSPGDDYDLLLQSERYYADTHSQRTGTARSDDNFASSD